MMEAEEILVRLLSRWYKRSVTIGVRATLCVVLLLRILTKHVRTYSTYAHMLAWIFNNYGGGGGGGDGDSDDDGAAAPAGDGKRRVAAVLEFRASVSVRQGASKSKRGKSLQRRKHGKLRRMTTRQRLTEQRKADGEIVSESSSDTDTAEISTAIPSVASEY